MQQVVGCMAIASFLLLAALAAMEVGTRGSL
jgi:hypothetical protein